VDLVDGSTLTEVLRHTEDDYSYSWEETSRLVRRIGDEEEIPQSSFDHIECFVKTLSAGSLHTLLRAFHDAAA